jgi:hypothetical protein
MRQNFFERAIRSGEVALIAAAFARSTHRDNKAFQTNEGVDQ